MQLILSNKTDNFLKVTIFPKKELPYSVFKYSERDRNVFIDTIFYDESGNKINKTSINEGESSYFLVERKIDEYRKKYKIEK